MAAIAMISHAELVVWFWCQEKPETKDDNKEEKQKDDQVLPETDNFVNSEPFADPPYLWYMFFLAQEKTQSKEKEQEPQVQAGNLYFPEGTNQTKNSTKKATLSF